MSYRKSFLVFVLAFAALTIGRSQEAMGQWGWDWGDLPPGFIDGGSTNFVYVCSQVLQGTNKLTPQESVQGATSDVFVSEGDVSCTFGKDRSGVVRGIVTGTDSCHYKVTWTGDIVTCQNTNAGAVVTVKSTCDNPNVSGSLFCPNLTFNGSPVLDELGISSKSECEKVFGKNANTLFTQATFAGQNCTTVLSSPTTAGLNFTGITQTTSNLCHSDGGSFVDCVVTPGGVTNKSNSAIPNLIEVACVASPQTWNVDCKGGTGTKDQGNGRVCYVNGESGFASFDPTKLDGGTATLNGVPVDETKQGKPLCTIKDCNGDGDLDFECTFPTCFGGNATAAPPLAAKLGELTMITSFQSNTGDTSGLTCTTPVGTSGQLP